ncbi:MAG: DEAD/DEAH box helicase [Armatimonadetes bacterium]|nr:DEAD/DEAH box helicase [Armatimonadota bacterium]
MPVVREPAMPDPLANFDPVIADWFAARYGTPTDIQALAWPVIARGEHVLLSAPTGSGKTLTAFLYALDRLLTGAWAGGGVRVLYISPLKALNNDIRRNLTEPLAALTERMVDQGLEPPLVRVETRSGDTPAADRRRLLKKPPEILITTPESLNLLLSSEAGRKLFGGLQTLILDEIHAVADSKRGTHLMTAVERLTLVAGEFQRVALSATVRPMETIAAYVGGYTFDGQTHRPRPMRILSAPGAKEYAVRVRCPDRGTTLEPGDWWRHLGRTIREAIDANQSTLVFVNSRRSAEKLALLLNENEPEPLAWPHHGSLSRETREVVEARLKRGELRAIVATGSLELGIDVGALDEVLLVETPFGVAQTLQRLGRAGHGVGQTSRGLFISPSGRDLLLAVVMSQCVANRDLEALQPPSAPLDVLAQVIIGVCAQQTWDVEDLFDWLRCCWSYHTLSRRAFDLVVEMLAGRYEHTRLTALAPRIHLDRLTGTVTAREDGVRYVRTQGGTIPDRGYFTLRVADSHAKLGELDEEFVWERRLGDVFNLGAQTWRIEGITHNDVLVRPSTKAAMAPFWKAEDSDRDSHYASRVGEFLELANQRLDDPELADWLAGQGPLDAGAAESLAAYLRSQRGATGCDLPHRHHVLIETVEDVDAEADSTQLMIHTTWGGRVNRPYGVALAAAFVERWGEAPQVSAGNDGVLLITPFAVDPAELMALVEPEHIEPLLRSQLERSGYFGARFRENAGRALLLARGTPRRRMPLWLSRQRSKQLLEQVSELEDFPVIVETWRTCLQDGFDLPVLRERLHELRDGAIDWSSCTSLAPSPFASGLAWRQVNKLMYEDDTPLGGRASLTDTLLRELIFTPELRPTLPEALCAEFTAKLQRTWLGYAPGSAAELADLVRDRWLLGADEWHTLLEAMRRDHALAEQDLCAELAPRLLWVTPPGGQPMVVALENLPRLLAAGGSGDWASCSLVDDQPAPSLDADAFARLAPDDEDDPLVDVLTGWLAYYAPVPLERLAAALGLPASELLETAEELAEEQLLVIDRLTERAAGPQVCTAENLDRLLRLARRARTPSLQPRPLRDAPLWLAQRQGLTRPADSAEGLAEPLGRLSGWSARRDDWEAELLPARAAGYQPGWLDKLVADGTAIWLGTGADRLTWLVPDLLDVVRAEAPPAPDWLPARGRHAAADLGLEEPEVGLWEAAWAGSITCDSAAVLRRRGAATRPAPVRKPRLAPGWWKGVAPSGPHWYRLPDPPSHDVLDQIELEKDRVRLLIERYGVVCREFCRDEPTALRWGAVFRAARLMELSGELVAGLFFEGLSGPQFTTPQLLAQLAGRLDEDAIYWLGATDPASLCGAGLADLGLPERRASNHLVYHGTQLVLTIRRGGKDLAFAVPPDAPRLDEYLIALGALLAGSTRGSLIVEHINDEPVRQSPFLPALSRRFRVDAGPETIRLWRAT